MALPIADAGSAGADIAYATWVGVTTRALADGGSTAGTGGSSIVSRQWTLISKPSGSAAALTGATTSTPTLTGIDRAGNYLVMLVVTDNLSAVSESDPFEAPASAFVCVRATTRYGALFKQAEGQRGYIAEVHGLVDAVDEAIGDIAALSGSDVVDVRYIIVPIAVSPNASVKFHFLDLHSAFGDYSALDYDGGTIIQALYRAAVAATSAGTITASIKQTSDDATLVSSFNLVGVGGSGQLVATPVVFDDEGAYIQVVSNNVTVGQPLGGHMHIWYIPAGTMT